MKKFKTYKSLTLTILAFTLILPSSFTYGDTYKGYPYKNVASWYEVGVREAEAWKVIPERFKKLAMDQPITRGEFAESVVLAYLSLTGELPEDWNGERFTDKPNDFANVASELGLVSGYDDGSFRSTGLIKREEMFVMIYKLISKVQENEMPKALSTEDVLVAFSDAMQISAWAKDATTLMVERSIVSGTDKKTLEPKQNTTRAQAMVILNNALKTMGEEPASSRKITSAYNTFLETAYAKKVGIKTEATTEASAEASAEASTEASSEASVEVVAKKGFNFDSIYTMPTEATAPTAPIVAPSRGGRRDHRTLEEIYTPEELLVMLGNNSVKYALIFGSKDAERYQTAAEALKHMVTISVDVWHLGANGIKTPSKRNVTIHHAIAETVKTIFKEIYEGPEQFPIKEVGGYAWRNSSTSEHRWGLAIDFNYSENYMIRKDGTIVAGSFWLPGVNPYSIKPDGDVVRAFKKHGFSWGGDAWPMSNDYMHFSFLGE